MGIPEDIKENVRAVLLSKTDGSGILVSTFLRDYKTIILKPLMYKDMGYSTLEQFIKDLPDVCRLEYSDQHMAFKLFGIAKPNTYVSSFVKRAEGGNEEADSGRRGGNKLETVRPTNDLNEKWEPSSRGLYTLCFPNKKGNGLDTKEAVIMKFAQLGEVVEVSCISTMTFVRYRDEKVAKKAVQLYGDEIRLRRADERVTNSSSQRRDNKKSNSSGSFKGQQEKKSELSPSSYKESSDKREYRRPLASDFDDDNWDDDEGSNNKKPSPGGYGGYSSNTYQQNHGNDVDRTYRGAANSSGREEPHRQNYDRQRGSKQDTRDGHYQRQDGHYQRQDGHYQRQDGHYQRQDGHYQRQEEGAHRPVEDGRTSPVQVYIGNWPSEANEADLKALLSPYECLGCRILQAKDSKMKKFAFVDLKDESVAHRLIKDLNKTEYRNRDLQCRLGRKKPSGDDSHKHDNIARPKGSIEQEFENLSVHRGIPKVDNRMTKSESKGQEDKMPQLESPKMPLLESPRMPPLESQRMPHLESSKMPPLESPRMPPLESPRMPPLESSKMPPLESPKMPVLETPSYSYNQMPPLESLDVFPHEMPPLEKVMSPALKLPVSGGGDQNGYNLIQLNIGNFPYGTSETELMMLLGPYGAQKITIMNKDMTSRSTYAFADFVDVSQAVHAMDHLDQSIFKGRKLVVTSNNPGVVFHQQNIAQSANQRIVHKQTVPQSNSPGVAFHKHNVAQVPNLMCTVTGDADRTVYIQDTPRLSPAAPNSLDAERAYEKSLRPNRSNFNYQRLTQTLQDYTRISTKLRADELDKMVEGMTLSVIITHIENERFFWGQILEDSVNGKNRGLQHLGTLALEMQREPHMDPIGGLGRCLAKYEDEWFRAWCTFLTERNGQEVGDVLFIDYGNRAFAQKLEMVRTKPPLWSLPPMAQPFKLVDLKYDLDKYLNQAVTLEVVEPGTNRTNSVATVRFCWM